MFLVRCVDLRKDWKRQKKTIDQLVRTDGEEDRQVRVQSGYGLLVMRAGRTSQT